jgi:tRNA-binding protein
MIDIKDFGKLDLRVGKILSAESLEKAKTQAYKLKIDFGRLGKKQSSAQITELYTTDRLIGRTIIAVTNFKPKKIAGFNSEVLVLGIQNEKGAIVLLSLDIDLKAGSKVS